MPNQSLEFFSNSTNMLRGYKHRIKFEADGHTMKVADGKDFIRICRRNRLGLYKHGIAHRVERLAKSSLLHRIPENLSGAFVDCGANIGELGICSRSRGRPYAS